MNRKRTDRNVDIARNASSSSSTSISSNEPVYKNQTPFVLELHDIRKDEPATDPLAPIGPSEGRIKKHKKKKKHSHHRNASVGSLDSLSDQSSVAPSATDVHEEFYDAHESYHAIPEGTPLGGATTLAIAENISKVETTLLPPSPETTTDDPIAPTSTPIIKPTSPP